MIKILKAKINAKKKHYQDEFDKELKKENNFDNYILRNKLRDYIINNYQGYINKDFIINIQELNFNDNDYDINNNYIKFKNKENIYIKNQITKKEYKKIIKLIKLYFIKTFYEK